MFTILINVLLALQAVQTSEDILKIKQDIEADLFPEDQTWGRSDANVSFPLMHDEKKFYLLVTLLNSI